MRYTHPSRNPPARALRGPRFFCTRSAGGVGGRRATRERQKDAEENIGNCLWVNVAHPVGQWSVFLWFAFGIVSKITIRFETPMAVRTAPRIFIKHKARTLSNIEIRFDYTDFGKNVTCCKLMSGDNKNFYLGLLLITITKIPKLFFRTNLLFS